MTRRTARRAVTLAALVGLALAAGAVPAHGARKHRLKIPPRPAFPRQLSVDEIEYDLRPSRTIVSSGRVRIFAYNNGMDDHDITVYDASGAAVVPPRPLPPGGGDDVTVSLPAGSYRVVCSLFAGTPISHETLGMRFTLTVADPPRAGAATARALR